MLAAPALSMASWARARHMQCSVREVMRLCRYRVSAARLPAARGSCPSEPPGQHAPGCSHPPLADPRPRPASRGTYRLVQVAACARGQEHGQPGGHEAFRHARRHCCDCRLHFRLWSTQRPEPFRRRNQYHCFTGQPNFANALLSCASGLDDSQGPCTHLRVGGQAPR